MRRLTHLTIALAIGLLSAGCGRDAMTEPGGHGGGHGGSGGSERGGGGAGAGGGGAAGAGATGGAGGAAVTLPIRLPDGGISALLGDGGLLGGILDAPRDSVIGQAICGPEVKLGATCSTDVPLCVLRSLGGVCYCANGTYLCPISTTSAPQACPAGAASGGVCLNPLAVCIGGNATACICTGTYLCL